MLRRQFLCILMAILMVGGVLTSPTFATENIIELYVSPDGSDNNTGTFDNPFKTIERAKEAVAQHNRNMTGDIYVYLRGGNYFVDKTICFTEKDGGTNGYTVYYKNYENESPVIYGGVRLTQWQPYQDGIYMTEIPEGMDFYSLTENLEWATEACYPNEGYLAVAREGISDGKNTVIYFNRGDIPETVKAEGLRVKNFPYLHYASAVWPVTKIDRENNAVHMNSKGEDYSVLKTNSDGLYRLIGDISFLDSKGEFYIDRDNDILYYCPYNENIDDSIIVAPMVKRLLNFAGDGAQNPVKNISVSGLTLSTTDFAESFHQGNLAGRVAGSDAMIKLESAQNICISNCRILNSGINAFLLDGFAQDNTISGNIIKNVGYVGILLNGYTAREALGRFDSLEDAYCNKNNTIHNNYIRRVGLNAAHGAGIQLYQSGDNTITHNEISHSPRYGISLKGESNPGGLRFWGIDIPASGNWLYDSKSMVYDLRFAQNNYIAYNDLYDCMKETRDGGVFETNSAGRGNRFENNLVHDTAAADVGGMFFGIYMDGGSMNWRVEKNIVYNLSSKGGGTSLLVNPGMNNQIQNNIIDSSNGNVGNVGITGLNTVFNKNILYSDDYVQIGGGGLNSIVSMENNLYYSGTGEYNVVGADGQDTMTSWKNKGVYDQNSVVGELPEFKNISNHDYSLDENSPAKVLGIEDCAVSAGLTSDFALERESNTFPEMLDEIGSDESDSTTDPSGSLRVECESAEYVKSNSPTADYIGGVNTGSYIGFYKVDLTNVKQITIRYSVPSGCHGHEVQLRTGVYSGTLLGKFITESTGGSSHFITTTVPITAVSGKNNVYLCFPELHSGYGNFDWVRFETDNGTVPQKDVLSNAAVGTTKGMSDFGDVVLVLGGECVYNSGAYTVGNTVMVPIDTAASKLGFVHNLTNSTVTDKEGNSLTYCLDSAEILVNGVSKVLPYNVIKGENNKIFVPCELFSIAFGDCVMYSKKSGYCRTFDVDRADLENNPDNPDGDLVWGKSVFASSKQGNSPWFVADGDSNTLWKPYDLNREWIQIDLGSRQTFNATQINWGDSYARAFEIYASDTDELPINKEKPLYSYYTFGGGNWEREFDDVTARYITINLESKSGVSAPVIYDIKVFNK